METSTVFAWFMALIPLSISPGPANVLFAASGGIFGVRATVPFWLGTNLICVLQSLAVGLGFTALIVEFPDLAMLLKYAGVAVLLYFAVRFFISGVSMRNAVKPLSFKEGMVVELLNAKYLLIPVVMFSQFYNPEENALTGLIALTLALAALTMVSNFIWVAGGNMLTSLLARDWVAKYQGAFFGSLLFATAIWLALDS